MKIVIFGGTTEGRELSRLLADRGAEIVVSVATEYGREEQRICNGVTVVVGRKDRVEMGALLRGATLCVDATHPYAVEASKNIRAACEDTRTPYRRLLREASASDADAVFADASGAATYLEHTSGNILLTTGAKELRRYANLDPSRLYPRILPAHDGLSACEALGIPRRNIIAMQGPFSRELNEALIVQYKIAYLVTKDGGTVGGFPEKAEAARNTGAKLILIRRPDESGGSFAEIAAYCEKLLRGAENPPLSPYGDISPKGGDKGAIDPQVWDCKE